MSPQAHLDDAGLSAMLDGVADPDVRQHAANCAECLDRLARWESVRSLVAGPVPAATEAVKAAAVAAALASADLGPAATRPPLGSTPRPVPNRPRRVGAVLAGVAAAIMIAAVSLAVVHGGRATTNHGVSGVATRAPSGATSGTSSGGPPSAAAGTAAPSAKAAPLSPAALPAVPDLGAIATPQQLAARLRLTNTATTGPSSPAACSTQAGRLAPAPRLVGMLTYQARPAVVYVSGRTGWVLERDGCALLLRVSF